MKQAITLLLFIFVITLYGTPQERFDGVVTGIAINAGYQSLNYNEKKEENVIESEIGHDSNYLGGSIESAFYFWGESFAPFLRVSAIQGSSSNHDFNVTTKEGDNEVTLEGELIPMTLNEISIILGARYNFGYFESNDGIYYVAGGAGFSTVIFDFNRSDQDNDYAQSAIVSAEIGINLPQNPITFDFYLSANYLRLLNNERSDDTSGITDSNLFRLFFGIRFNY